MDLGDPRESLVSLKTPGTWEADNRVEERWQWGAQLLDLCNLSPEDYKNSTAVIVKTIQDCGECGGGGGGQVTENKGSASLSDDGQFIISFEESVATKLYVFVTFTDDLGSVYSFEVSVDKGSDNAAYDVSSLSSFAPYTITDIKLGFKEDGSDADDSAKDKKYEYTADYGGGGSEDGKTYVFSILCTETDNLTGNDYKAIIDAQGQGFDYIASYDETDFGGVDTAQAIFYLPCIDMGEYIPEGPERDAFYAVHSHDFVFLTKKTINEIKEDFTEDTEFWVSETITMDGETYYKWMRRDLSGAQCPSTVGGGCDGYDLVFTLRIKK